MGEGGVEGESHCVVPVHPQVQGLRIAMLDESSVEGSHASYHRLTSTAPGHRTPWAFSAVRLEQNLADYDKFVEGHASGSKMFATFWERHKHILQHQQRRIHRFH